MSEHEHDSHQLVMGPSGKPRPDDTPPRNGVIFFYTVLVVLTLICLKFVMDSFLDSSRRAIRAQHLERSRANELLAEHREREREALGSGEMPIDRAMRELAQRGRGAFPQVRPFPSTDRGALEGWNRRGPTEAPVTPEPSEPSGLPTR
ncbi:MAG: hypothetical protein OHK0013_06690 [Sandaracinaceae bacterium]